MKSQGITAVRVPISYYHFLPGHPDKSVQHLMKGTEYESFANIYQSAFSSIQQTIQRAAEHDIGVLIDLHAAPGGQNGEGHSGLSGGKADFYNRSNMRNTISILKAVINTFGSTENVIGVELINEPQDNGKLADWYKDAIKELRTDSASPHLPLYLGDCWNPNKYSQVINSHKGKAGALVLDHHYYRCFTPQDCGKSAAQHAAEIEPSQNGSAYGSLCNTSSQLQQSVVIGEWSAALNPGSLKDCGGDKKGHQRNWARAQLNAYNAQCGGHFFWTLKKEGAKDVGWCLYSAIEEDILPSGLGKPRGGIDLNQVEQNLKQQGKSNYDGHVEYWNKNSGGKPMHHEKYRDGFDQLLNDCLAFYRISGEVIGFVGLWVGQRAASHSQEHGSENEWEFVHGGNKAVELFTNCISQS
jgi:glucan 1,3-beta-glucosidase